jgi:hypothetical protein
VNVRPFSGAEHVVYDYETPPELVPTFKEAVSQVGGWVRNGYGGHESIGRYALRVFLLDAIHARGPRLPLNAPVPGFTAVFKRYRQESTLLTVASKPFTNNPTRELPRHCSS